MSVCECIVMTHIYSNVSQDRDNLSLHDRQVRGLGFDDACLRSSPIGSRDKVGPDFIERRGEVVCCSECISRVPQRLTVFLN